MQKFLQDSKTGFAQQLDNAITQLAGSGDSLLTERLQALQTTVSDNESRIAAMQTALNVEQQNMLQEFQQTELVVEKMQNNMSLLNSLAESLGVSTGSSGSSSSAASLATNSDASVASTSGSSGSSGSSDASSSSTS